MFTSLTSCSRVLLQLSRLGILGVVIDPIEWEGTKLGKTILSLSGNLCKTMEEHCTMP